LWYGKAKNPAFTARGKSASDKYTVLKEQYTKVLPQKQKPVKPWYPHAGITLAKMQRRRSLPRKKITKAGIPDLESMSVDAACSGNPGIMEYRGVYSKTREEIFHQGPFKEGTNNIGEFLALVHGLAFLKQKNSPLPIYTDSKTALAWVKSKKAKTKLKKNVVNSELFDLIARAEIWLQNNKYTTQIMKWETSVWGEIPADFGRK
jgi:ribonuclease HI